MKRKIYKNGSCFLVFVDGYVNFFKKNIECYLIYLRLSYKCFVEGIVGVFFLCG